MNSSQQVIVVGGGAAGLMAAGQAAAAGAQVLLLEKMRRPGRKLLITGKGRCNLTNVAPLPEFIEHFGRNGRFLRQAFARFFTPDLIAFFDVLNLPTVTERGGRVFPVSQRAADVVEALQTWCRQSGATIQPQSRVNELLVENGEVTGVVVNQAGKLANYPARAVIIATGGASYPATGSTGDGYRLAEAAGHTIIPIRPALVPLETAGPVAGRLQGLSLRNVSARVLVDGRVQAEAFGEMLFTHFGLSGPIILSLSKRVVDALQEQKTVQISINLKPALDQAKLDARLQRDFDAHGKQRYRNVLKNLLPSKLIPVAVELTGIPANKVAHQITGKERRRLCNWLQDFCLEVSGHRSFAEAIVTAGGVSTREVNPRTMESRLVLGLYFAGEVMDLDGDTGGYNLQCAFSTGWLAGRVAAG